jgi:hypothetical protein
MYFSSAICVYTQLNQKIPLLEEKIKLGAEMFRHWVLHDISSLVFFLSMLSTPDYSTPGG